MTRSIFHEILQNFVNGEYWSTVEMAGGDMYRPEDLREGPFSIRPLKTQTINFQSFLIMKKVGKH